MSFKQLTEHVWIWPCMAQGGTQPNIGAVIGESVTILIDAGNGAPHATLMRDALQKMEAPPVQYIVYTHHHWDHVFGAYIFEAPVIANVRSVPFLQEKQQFPWGKSFLQRRWERYPRLREQIAHQRQAAGSWEALKIVLPDVTFDDRFSLSLPDGLQLEMWHVGGVHAYDSIVVQVVEDGVLFVGDSFYSPPTYELEPEQEEGIEIGVIERFLRDDVPVYVDGHSKPYSRRQMQMLVRWQLMKDEVKKGREGKPLEAAGG